MGKIDINNFGTYSNTNQNKEKTKFFSLKNDSDVAQIRFCHNTIDDIEGVALHSVKDDQGITRKISCLRDYEGPLDNCPFCKYNSEHPEDKRIGGVQNRIFLTLVEYKQDVEGKISYEKKVWERGAKFKKELDGLVKRYNPLCKQVFEIERQGQPGDSSTKYGIYPIPGGIEEFPLTKADLENKSVVGSIVAVKTVDDMNTFIQTGSFLKKRNTETNTTGQTSTDTQQPTSEDLPFTQPVRRRL